MKKIAGAILICAFWGGCKKKSPDPVPPPGPTPVNFSISSWSVNTIALQNTYYNVNRSPVVKFRFGG